MLVLLFCPLHWHALLPQATATNAAIDTTVKVRCQGRTRRRGSAAQPRAPGTFTQTAAVVILSKDTNVSNNTMVRAVPVVGMGRQLT